MRIDDLTSPLRKALAANANTSSFAAKPPTIAEPTNDGVVNLTNGGVVVPQHMLILPYGLGANNDAFDMRVLGWRHAGSSQGAQAALWVPVIIGQFSCICGNVTGVAATGGQTPDVLATEFFCDTITVSGTRGALQPRVTNDNGTGAEFGGTIRVSSPANDTVAFVLLPLLGMEKVEFQFDQTTNTPTMNALIALL